MLIISCASGDEHEIDALIASGEESLAPQVQAVDTLESISLEALAAVGESSLTDVQSEDLDALNSQIIRTLVEADMADASTAGHHALEEADIDALIAVGEASLVSQPADMEFEFDALIASGQESLVAAKEALEVPLADAEIDAILASGRQSLAAPLPEVDASLDALIAESEASLLPEALQVNELSIDALIAANESILSPPLAVVDAIALEAFAAVGKLEIANLGGAPVPPTTSMEALVAMGKATLQVPLPDIKSLDALIAVGEASLATMQVDQLTATAAALLADQTTEEKLLAEMQVISAEAATMLLVPAALETAPAASDALPAASEALPLASEALPAASEAQQTPEFHVRAPLIADEDLLSNRHLSLNTRSGAISAFLQLEQASELDGFSDADSPEPVAMSPMSIQEELQKAGLGAYELKPVNAESPDRVCIELCWLMIYLFGI